MFFVLMLVWQPHLSVFVFSVSAPLWPDVVFLRLKCGTEENRGTECSVSAEAIRDSQQPFFSSFLSSLHCLQWSGYPPNLNADTKCIGYCKIKKEQTHWDITIFWEKKILIQGCTVHLTLSWQIPLWWKKKKDLLYFKS